MRKFTFCAILVHSLKSACSLLGTGLIAVITTISTFSYMYGILSLSCCTGVYTWVLTSCTYLQGTSCTQVPLEHSQWNLSINTSTLHRPLVDARRHFLSGSCLGHQLKHGPDPDPWTMDRTWSGPGPDYFMDQWRWLFNRRTGLCWPKGLPHRAGSSQVPF